MQICKHQVVTPSVSGTPTPEELEKILPFCRAPLPPENLYVFKAVLCNNEVDRDNERFSRKALATLAKLFVGKTGLFDHSGKTEDQVMRVFEATVVDDETRRTSQGEVWRDLQAKVYLLRNPANQDLIAAIDGGIKREVSVNCAVRRVSCSLCGLPLHQGECKHKKGLVYDEQLCHAVLENPSDAFEFSFVAVPAQPAAGVLKRKKAAAGQELAALQAELAALQPLAEDGKRYRAGLLQQVLNGAAKALPTWPQPLLKSMCAPLDSEALGQLFAVLQTQLQAQLPLRPQLTQASEASQGSETFRFATHPMGA